MFYSMAGKQIGKLSYYCAVLLILILSESSIQSNVFASAIDESVQDYRLSGYREQQKGNLEAALGFYSKAIGISPDRPDVLNDLGVVYESMGLEDQAEAKYLAAIAADRTYLPPYMNLAYLYERKQDVVKASQYLQKRILLGKQNDPWTQKAQQEFTQLEERVPLLRRRRIEREALQFNADLNAQIKEDALRKIYQAKLQTKKYVAEGQRFMARRQYAQAVDAYDNALAVALPEDKPIVQTAQHSAQLVLSQQQIRLNTENAIKLLASDDPRAARKEIQKMLTAIPNKSSQSQISH